MPCAGRSVECTPVNRGGLAVMVRWTELHFLQRLEALLVTW